MFAEADRDTFNNCDGNKAGSSDKTDNKHKEYDAFFKQ